MSGLFTFPAVAVRFFSKVRVEESGCWVWTAATSSNGYGKFGIGPRVLLTHRVSFELLRGPIPLGMQLDHVCRVKTCVNPAHLEPVTTQENTRRYRETVTHCARGHAFSGENVFLRNCGRYLKRCCRICQRQSGRDSYVRQKAKEAAQ